MEGRPPPYLNWGGRNLKKLDKKVLITTTTKIYEPKENYDYYFLGNITEDFRPTNGSITIIGEKN